MSQLEQLQPNAALRGILPDALVTVVSVQWFGSEAIELTYKTPTGRVANELLYHHDEPRIDLVEQGRPWSFDGDGAFFRLVSEAQRIRLAYLFDPVLAVHTSVVDPLPHQITAVYGTMLPRQPVGKGRPQSADPAGQHRHRRPAYPVRADALSLGQLGAGDRERRRRSQLAAAQVGRRGAQPRQVRRLPARGARQSTWAPRRRRPPPIAASRIGGSS